MEITDKHIQIPSVFEYNDSYVNGEKPMLAITKHVMKMRNTLRATALEETDTKKMLKAREKYWKGLEEVYAIERDMHEMAKFFMDDVGVSMNVSALYHFLYKTRTLFNLPRRAIHLDRLPFNSLDFKEFFNSWWSMILVELEEDPRVTLGDSVKFRDITGSTIIEDTDYRGKMKKKGAEILRRNGEVFSGNEDDGGAIFMYMWIQDNPSETLPTKTVFCFSMAEGKKPEIRVFPIILNIEG